MNVVDLGPILKNPAEDPCRKLWAMFILLAVMDEATELRYEPWCREKTLLFTVAGKEYEMIPPPTHLSLAMVEAIREFIEPKQEGWRARLAQRLRKWADLLDPPAAFQGAEFAVYVEGQFDVSVRANPPRDTRQWPGVVLRFTPNQSAADKARALFSPEEIEELAFDVESRMQ